MILANETEMPEKVCPVVYRKVDGIPHLLAFQHPSGDYQFVKGTIQEGECHSTAALRELREESGLHPTQAARYLGQSQIGAPPLQWHFYAFLACHAPEQWKHRTEDDCGHTFSFFWHPLVRDLDHQWHLIFHEALQVIRRTL
ncbi:8-oxo-dGTP pyrophosphatase MutT, NUDIX family [Bosea sp. OK403]|nr:8-oxo-dGTP pyrophosphatase MutT, NUDIX family [Bosea sp. OK403]